MVQEANYTIGDIYQGGYSSLKNPYGDIFTGYKVSAGSLGLTTDPRTANQLQALSQSLNQGAVPIELMAMSPDVFDTIPKDHFKEMNRMAKLTGAKISLHAPVQGMEPSGIDPEGRKQWQESDRIAIERRLQRVIDSAATMEPGSPVTIHSSNIPGSEFKKDKEGKMVYDKMMAVNRDTGQLQPIVSDERYYAGRAKEYIKEELTPEKQIGVINNTQWSNDLQKVEFNREHAERILKDIHSVTQGRYIQLYHTRQLKPESVSQEEWGEFRKINSAAEYLKQANMETQTNFSKAYKWANKEKRETLDKISKKYSETLGLDKQGNPTDARYFDPKIQSQALFDINKALDDNHLNPNLFVPVEEFALDKSSQTFANLALNSYKKHKDKSPIISIENMFSGFAFTTGKDMEKLILESRKKFAAEAAKQGIMSESEARKKADQLIGMTFDVGHLNTFKQKGFTDADLVKEAEKTAKYVKHVHLTDNFGYGDTHLPPGMGNVPIKKHLEVLEKAGVLDKVRKINEVGGWFEHFKTNPYMQILGAFGSPVYSSGSDVYWHQVNAGGMYQGYFGGFGNMLPQKSYGMFGAGFSQLPTELGGQAQQGGGEGSRMSGTPME